MSVQTRPLTADDLDHFPDDGKRREIIAGELFVSPAPSIKHQELAGHLYYLLHQAVILTGWGKVYFAPVDVRFSTHDQVQPDLLVIRRERLEIGRGNTVHGAPDLVVEILSPSNRNYDEVEKARLYAEAGVPEYWIMDPMAHVCQMLTLVDGRYDPVTPDGGLLRSNVVPGLVVDPATLFARLKSE